MSTLEEALSMRNCLSEYHVYHGSGQNVSITPFINKKMEFGYNKRRQSHREEAEVYEASQRQANEANSYFLHQPKHLFSNPPRLLRRGSDKDGEPICLIYSAPFWDHWNVQFKDNLNEIVDPRGMIPFENRSRRDNSIKGDGCAWKGYKVRSWRVWGESGKAYHQRINARRKMREEEGHKVIPAFEPLSADEAIKLSWSFPFVRPRRYEFQYAGINFIWKGTRDLPVDEKFAKVLLPLNHLKLIATDPKGNRYFIAFYSSAFNPEKYGRLWVFDNMISNLLEQSGGSQMNDYLQNAEEGSASRQESDIRRTRIYELVMATSMCMVLGEWEKRATLYLMLLMLVIAGRNAVIAS
ncbi:uncharacterized protein N7469_009178 [Penicillium citrinum]|uniref:Uncharacterized protein n=1 Tax=Penicillium citrinum TaxID=5077 RepID=A0A9W9NQE8_PENCI|nr:uncharacterized protein N7469_009178 [Penicillium citrinum]KAJ5222938.1 hypothetical protein N7469_009178 [Penicillium citrinum]